MSPQQFKTAINSELKYEGFNTKITNVSDDKNFPELTVLSFTENVPDIVFNWLNARFSGGVRAGESSKTIIINPPNLLYCAPK